MGNGFVVAVVSSLGNTLHQPRWRSLASIGYYIYSSRAGKPQPMETCMLSKTLCLGLMM